jgi:hypothetical protein
MDDRFGISYSDTKIGLFSSTVINLFSLFYQMHGKIILVKIYGGQQEEKPKDRLIDTVTRDAREVLGTA